jgi:hypothetical protein
VAHRFLHLPGKKDTLYYESKMTHSHWHMVLWIASKWKRIILVDWQPESPGAGKMEGNQRMLKVLSLRYKQLLKLKPTKDFLRKIVSLPFFFFFQNGQNIVLTKKKTKQKNLICGWFYHYF